MNKAFNDIVHFIYFWKWNKEEFKVVTKLLMFTILIALTFFYLGRVYECNEHGGMLGAKQSDTFIVKYINPRCVIDETNETKGLDNSIRVKFID
jgi:hypothetical protein